MLASALLSAFVLLAAVSGVAASPTTKRSAPPGFVTTKGTQFELDGEPFAFVGANSYWLPLLLTQSDVESTFQTMSQAGVKVLRTWGFNAINGSELAGAKESGLTYYQIWNSSSFALNAGSQGLERLDNVIETAGKHGIKVIVAFSNNWVGYGGSDLYIQWMAPGSTTHDVFFKNPSIITAYQSYVRTIVERYKDSPNIFAWELLNEARCSSDTYPSGPSCTPASGAETLLGWYKEQSDFVRSLDPDHLITTGGEGHFFWTHPRTYWFNGQLVSDYNWNGQAGEDFDRNLALSNIDFATYHMYPQSWYPELDFPGSNFSIANWGLQWINDHINAGNRADKPIVLEEFGLGGLDNKTQIYPTWVQHALDTKHASIMPWQFGVLGLTEDGGNRIIKYSDAVNHGASPNDGNTFYPNQTAVWNIFTRAAEIQAQRSQ
ncbi:glycoside hydrolase family 5 protein [Phanerochaete carnosa HHB-10118-sp]|uniref:mannan endo-1,4-beta-mannosidase n=1 Tax=Phanerochaete carnosa (strain HHB-10118-sp) TaxID=650164 RepID=K5WNY7_PHACS|nr:glycoside hydrolase family 5 protein [Phanerochaete carnosa HHB-10118-sp]EKM61170.1 glycoside hydrolase family 5 protein [Phanerochaete carnosa HHB-10118-sp]